MEDTCGNCSEAKWFNQSLEDYLTEALGPKHLPLGVVLPLTIIYVFIFVSGIVGNVAVCLVIARNKSMRTATNYYLFSLAVSDLTLLVLGLPYELSVFWQQYPWLLGEAFCKLRALGSEMSSYTSILTIVAFSTERYLAICQPIQSYTTSSPRIAIRVIGVLWVISLVCALPFAVYTKINYVEYPPGSSQMATESAFCAMLKMPANWPMYELSAFVFFLGPMLVIMVLYARMGITIRSRSLRFPGETKHLDSRTKPIIRMLAAVVITFFLCWAPFHMQRLFFLYGKNFPNYDKINEIAYFITGCLYFFSCTVNPVLYNVMSAKYRLAFRKTLCCGDHIGGPTREASTLRDTTVVYVNSHLERCRSSSMHREVRPMRSLSRVSKNSNVPNNKSEKTHSSLMHVDNEKLLDPSCDPPYTNQASDIIVMMSPSSNGKTNSYKTSTTWSKALLRIAKNNDASEPCLKQTEDSKNNTQHKGETSI